MDSQNNFEFDGISLSMRIEKIANTYAKSINEFAKSIGEKTHDNVRNIIKGNTKEPKFNLIYSILNTYREINARWLITGEGEMLNTPTSYKLAATGFDMVNEHGEGVCYKCYAKDGQINLLEKQVSEKDATIAELNKTIGKLQNKLDNCGCDNGKNAHSA